MVIFAYTGSKTLGSGVHAGCLLSDVRGEQRKNVCMHKKIFIFFFMSCQITQRHAHRHTHKYTSRNVVRRSECVCVRADVCYCMHAPSVIGLHREQRGGPVLFVVAVSSPLLEN